MEGGSARREFLISKVWLQTVILVVLVGFFVLGLLAYRTYVASPPVPDRVVDDRGATLFTGGDVSHGQKVFLNSGLMEYGSIFGHGAYLGPDFTADYLRRAVEHRRSTRTAARGPTPPHGARLRTSGATATTRTTSTLAFSAASRRRSASS